MHKQLKWGILAAAALMFSTTGFAASLTGPLTLAELQGLTSGADYGPPPPVRGHDENTAGPLVFSSGADVTLYGAPGTDGVEGILLIFSATAADVATLGSIVVDFSTPNFSAVNLTAADFFSTADAGFPTGPPGPGVPGIGDGEVNGIKFPDAVHAALFLVVDDVSSIEVDDVVAVLTVVSSINLRVDIFGVDDDSIAGGTIANNASNSGAFGITPPTFPPQPPDIPEPATLALFGMGLLGVLGRKVSRARNV